MKQKLTLLFLALLTTAGMWADDVTSYDGEFYYIHNNNNTNKYVGPAYQCQTTQTYGALFRIKQVTHNDATCYTIYNMNTGKYVNYKDTSEGTTKLEGGSLGDKSYWDITFVSGTAVTICPQGSSNSWNFWGGNSDPNPVGLYRSSDGNSKWRLEKVAPVSSTSSLGAYKYGVISVSRGGWAVSGTSATSLSSTHDQSLAVAIDTKQQFAFVPYNEEWYLYSVGAGKFVHKDGSLTLGAGDPITFVSTGTANYPFLIKFDDSHCINLGGSSQIAINGWGDIPGEYDAGNQLALIAEGDYSLTAATNVLNGTTPPISVTYEVYYNGTKKDDATIETLGGYAPSLPASLTRDFCTYSYFSDSEKTTPMATLPTTNCTVYVNATWDGPFTISSDYASISDWYFLKLKNQRYATYESASEPNVTLNQTSPTVDTRWAFVGNPYDGFKLYNKTAGSTKVLASASVRPGTSEGGNDYTWMVAEDDATYTYNTWTVKESTAIDAVTGFYLYNSQGYAMNYRADANLAFWTGGTGSGSTFSVEHDNINFAESVAAYSSYFDNENKDKYFGISTSDASALQDDYDTYSVSCTEDQYLAFRDAMNAAIIIPATGYYRLKNKSVSSYLGATTGLVGVTSGTGAETIVYLTNNGNGTFNLATQGKYINQSGSQYGGQLPLGTSAQALQYDIPEASSVVFSFAAGNWTHKSICLVDGLVQNAQASEDASKWELEDASTVIINLNAANDNTGSAHTYATLCVPFEITDLTGIDDKEVKAYAPTKSGDYIVPGSGATTITEGTPVLLIGEEGASSVTATIGSDYATSPATTNALTGTFTAATIDTRAETGTNFVLGFDEDNDNRIGFYNVNNESFALKANRAYLKLDGSGDPTHVKGFVIDFDDDATSINCLIPTLSEGEGTIYNLAGQRVSKIQKGINIINGKKILK